MSAEDPGPMLVPGKGRYTVDAVAIGVRLVHRYVETVGTQRVTREQESRLAIEHHDVRRLVAGRRNDIEYAAAEVIQHDLIRPVSDLEEVSHALGIEADDSGVRSILEFGVTLVVVAVAVGMGDDQR